MLRKQKRTGLRKNHRMYRRIFAYVLSLCMIVGSLGVFISPVFADEEISEQAIESGITDDAISTDAVTENVGVSEDETASEKSEDKTVSDDQAISENATSSEDGARPDNKTNSENETKSENEKNTDDQANSENKSNPENQSNSDNETNPENQTNSDNETKPESQSNPDDEASSEDGASTTETSTTEASTIEPSTAEPDSAQEKTLSKTTYDLEGNVYDVEVTYKDTAGIPMEGTDISVTELKPEDEGYDEYMAASADKVGTDVENIKLAKAFDIKIVDENNEEIVYEPIGDVEVSIRLVGEKLEKYENLDVLHFVEDDRTDEFEVIDMESKIEDETVKFTTDSFSVYVVAGYVLGKTITASDGNTYKISVNYDESALLPEDVDLSVEEITKQSEGFDEYMEKAAERLGKDVDDVVYSRFFDISLVSKYDPNVHYQPQSEVSVSIDLINADEDMDALKVLHFGKNNVDIMDTTVDGTALNFKTDSFSIYPILDDYENARIAYRFWYYNTQNRKYEEIGTQFYRYKDVRVALQNNSHCIHDPGIPGIDANEMVSVFKGWYKGTFTGETPALETTPTSIDALNAELEARTQEQFIEGTYIDVFAELNSAYYITYVDINTELIRGTDLAIQAETGDTFFTVRSDVTVSKYQDDLKGWRRLEDIGDPDAILYEPGQDYVISENITLVPVIEGGYWLVYDDNDPVDDGHGNMVSGGASYTPPSFYLNNSSEQQTTVRPAMDPEWVGYSFEGWYIDAACTEEYTFGNLLTQDTTVYAKWIPADNFYTVIIWKQRATDPVDASDDDKHYDFVSSEVIDTKDGGAHVKTGDYIILNQDYTTIYGANGTSTDTDKSFFIYNQAKTDQYVVVKASGGSVFNVYYDRVPVTMNFYTWRNGYVYTETTAETGTQYGIVNNDYVPLTRVDGEAYTYTYNYSPAYTATTSDTISPEYGIVDGEYRQLNRVGMYSYSYNPYVVTTGNTGTQYALIDGEYVQLSVVEHVEYRLTSSLSTGDDYLIVSRNTPGSGAALDHNGGTVTTDAVTVNTGTAVTGNAPYILGSDVNSTSVWSVASGYTFKNGNYYIVRGEVSNTLDAHTLNVGRDRNWTWNGSNNTLYSTNTALLSGTTYYYIRYNNNAFSLNTSQSSVYLYKKVVYYTWHYTDSNNDTLEYTGTRYQVNSGSTVSYTGTRYSRTGSKWWDYYYTSTDEQGTGLYGVDDRGGHVALTRSNNANSYSYYDSTTGNLYTGTRYYAPNNNPVDYTGTLYTMPGGVPHVTTENAVSGLYGLDDNGVYRELNGIAHAQNLWQYEDPDTHEMKYYTGTRYTRSNSQQNSWQLYKSFTGLYASTYGENGYKWPAQVNDTNYNWYTTGYGAGGNAAATNQNRAGTGGGTRLTFTDTFVLGSKTSENYYGTAAANNQNIVIRFHKQNLDLSTYEKANEVYVTGGTFNISDKYEGFKPVAYSTNGGSTKTAVPRTEPDSNGYYGSVSNFSQLDIYFDRKSNSLTFFPDPEIGATPITKNVPYGKTLEEYADQLPGEKQGHYFVGWFADSTHTVPFDFTQPMPDAGVAVYGYWREERVRVIFVPNADNAYIDPAQALSFRVNYNETINGSMLEAATRPGYQLAGWYSDPEFREESKFRFIWTINTNTTGVDKTYQTSPRWEATRENYGDNVPKYENVRGVLVLYAKWIQDTEQSGVSIVYDAGEAALYDGLGYVSTDVPVDSHLYPDGSVVTVGAAPTNYSPLYVFNYWEIVDSAGNVVHVINNQGAQVDHFEEGFTFNVDWVSPEDAYNVTYAEGTDEVLIKTIRLRANYTKNSDAAEYFTTITYDGDTFDQEMYTNNVDVMQGKTRDGSNRTSITMDKEVNETIVLLGKDHFYLDGYTLVGWSFFEGSYMEQTDAAEEWNNNHPDNPVYVQTVDLDEDGIEETTVHYAPGQKVAADNLFQNTPNDESNTLYAMWLPKDYKVTVRQVVEDGVAEVHGNSSQFSYTYKSGVENSLPGTTQNLTLDGTTNEVFTTLSHDASIKYHYYGLTGHVFNITGPTIPASADYAVRVSATVLRDDGTVETLPLNGLGNYEINGDVTITYTYSLKVPVTLEKRDMVTDTTLTGAKFCLTPIEWDRANQVWKQVGTDTWTYDMTSTATQTISLQEGVYRVDEIQAPTNYAAMSEPLRLTVVKNSAFTLVNTSGGAVSANVAKLTGSDSHTLTIYDRPIREVTIKKVVDGTDVTTNGKYTFMVQLSLEGSELKGYDTVGSGNADDTTDNSGVIEVTLGNNETKTLRIPWGSVITVTESEYVQFGVSTESQQNVADTETETDRIYSCVVDVDDTITFTNTNRQLTVTNTVTGPMGDFQKVFTYTLSGLTAGKKYYFRIGSVNQNASATADGNISFTLKHGQTMTIALPDGTYTVSENEENHYTTSVALNGATAVEALSQEVTFSSGTTSNDVEFINYHPDIAPTGVDIKMIPFLLVFIAGVLLGTTTFVTGRRRRKTIL